MPIRRSYSVPMGADAGCRGFVPVPEPDGTLPYPAAWQKAFGGDGEAARWEELKRFACENELRFRREFDPLEFILVWERKIPFRLMPKPEIGSSARHLDDTELD